MLNNKRVFGLDIIRSLAIIAVIYNHTAIYLNDALPLQLDGVGIFFVLSGYLIGGILLDAINKPQFTYKHLLDFWVRRWLRTLPAYYIVLVFLLLFANRHSLVWGYNPYQVWKYFFFIQTIFNNKIAFFGESWSLAVEEWFYLIVPLLFYISLQFKFPPKKIVAFWIVAIVIAGFFLKLSVYYNADFTVKNSWDEKLRKPTYLRLDSIMFGVIAAYIKYYYGTIWEYLKKKYFLFLGILFFITGVIIFVTTRIQLPLAEFMAIYLNGIGTLLVLPALSTVKTGEGIAYKFFTFISKISYSIYLLNLSVFHALWPYLNHIHRLIAKHLNIPQKIFLTDWYILYYHILWSFIFSLAGAYILYSVVEKPFMRLRNKIKFS